MTRNNATRILLVLCGIALLFAGLFFDLGAAAAQSPMPTPDRLAQPTLPAQPSQADRGAQVYWLSCLPCHGDKGQGLTREFIEAYPEEDRNCWASGCHGANPYESGFTLPQVIPAVIGKEAALQRFGNAAALRAYIKAAMPYWKPGSLTDEQAWQATAFLLRENGLWDAKQDLNEENAARILFLPPAAPTQTDVQSASTPNPNFPAAFAAFAFAVLIVAFWKFFSKRSAS